MWKCKKCGGIDTVMPRDIEAVSIDENNKVHYGYGYAKCTCCGIEGETVEELAEWVDESQMYRY